MVLQVVELFFCQLFLRLQSATTKIQVLPIQNLFYPQMAADFAERSINFWDIKQNQASISTLSLNLSAYSA